MLWCCVIVLSIYYCCVKNLKCVQSSKTVFGFNILFVCYGTCEALLWAPVRMCSYFQTYVDYLSSLDDGDYWRPFLHLTHRFISPSSCPPGLLPLILFALHSAFYSVGYFTLLQVLSCEYSQQVPFALTRVNSKAGNCLCVIFCCCTYYSLLFVGHVT